MVQSIGGGGGSGGFSVASGVAASGGGSGAVSVGLGGKGAQGGTGGAVTVDSTGKVTTKGDSSIGLLAQSVGGGGGNGGFSVSVAGAAASVGSGAINVGLGGSGGAGNHAGDVTVNTSVGKITTSGADSHGIVAQSIGGGGGAGGYNVGVAAAGSGGGSGAISVGLGGSGGAGGYAGTVRLNVSNAVSTLGKGSSGVLAQSIGGGGGAGGYNVSAAGALAGSGAGAISVGLGGSGGTGNHGGEVYATVTNNVDTLLANSNGIVAQSIGGGGGSGGYNVSVSGAGGMGAGGISVGLGGNGAGGGNGLKVELTSTGTVITKGADSIGLLGQSIGGGGGSGGFNVSVAIAGSNSISGAVSVGLGGSGAGGGDGGIVILNSSGNVSTEGNNSAGIVGQSIGGGGGSGGFNVSVAGAIGNSFGGAAAVGLGGSGGGGGNAVGVTVTVNNNVSTKGKKSTAVIAQSIGGGGGSGGFDISAPVSGASGAAGSIGVSIGGSGAMGGHAGIVTSSVTGLITTEQEGSGGMLAQSIGGGGGAGGMSISGALSFSATGSGAISIGLGGSGGAGGDAANVYSTFNGSVYTVQKDSFGVVAQSIGGGGGSGGMSISGAIALAKEGAGALAFGLGGAGGEGGDAGALVRNIVNGYVQTEGANSVGVLSQSLGGGGGAGGLNVSGTITGAKQGSGGLAIGIGGLGGDGGVGKEVISTVTGGVVTAGKDSAAIVAQSIGGGGGSGGLNVSGSINVSKENGGTLGVGVGGFGGNGGNAGTVTSTVVATSAYNNLIGTLGDNSSAVVAQSIGGGGGDGGLNVTGGLNLTGKSGASIGVGLGGFGGVAGNGGMVTADVTGNIITQGNESHGIVAQSIGGAGGNGGINVTGTIAAAQSPATSAAVSIGVGGFGGNGGTSNSVLVNYNGTLTARPTVWVPTAGSVPGHYEYTDGAGSNGIMAQSIGGGGGNGGMNVSGGISYVGGTGHGYGVVVGVGGFGGDGGNAGTATVNVTGGDSITGYGTGHSAIVAQSLGGGGGNGGMNISGGITSDSGLLFGVGGFAGDAGTATTVRVTSTTNVFASTLNANEDEIASAGILAQSIGGGGGNGGLNVTGGLAIAKQAGVPSVNFGIGGFGGAGASSGDVIVNHTGNATTSGNWVHGIMAQSIAGGGGNGAMNVGGQLNFAASENSGGNTDLSIIAGIGGTAGDGSFAGNVTVTNNGIVSTKGDNARGVAAQSIGGGGGTGGMNVTGVYAKNSNPITVGIGGTGGSAGDAGNATIIRGSSVAATGKVTTDGVGAHAIEASSIGGGGGDAGMNFNVGYSRVGEGTATAGFAANFIIGGGGGDAASGKAATVTNYSAIETLQDKSYGILAQSIGGGGGNANFNIGVTHAGASTSAGSNLYNKPNQNMALSLAVGGATGDGGFGGDVTVTQVGNLTTTGKQSIGILAQSIGGGGGNAGLDVAFIKADGGKAGLTIGRVGGTGGYGGTVQLNYTGVLNTTGEMAFGLLAQSLGNGGGNSSSTTISGEIPSSQNDLGQTRPQSATLAIGLEGGVGGYGGNVTLNSNGSITTRGRRAYGVFAQSIGGGGGNGGKANSFGITAPVVAITLGGTGGSGGYGGQVDLTNTAVVETFGEEAVGLLAQSIGGGGGNGGSTYAGGTKTGDTGITVGIGGAGAAGMDGGIVNVINNGIVVTHDLAAHGILAQSIGGGGGDGGSAISMLTKMHPSNPNATDTTRVSVNVGGNGGTGGNGNAVNVTNHGGIGTYKAASVGIFAQSIGGGGGNGKSVLSASLAGTSGNNVGINIGGTGGTGGAGGIVTVKNEKTSDPDSAKIITLGDKAHGILAMSVGGGGGTGSNVAAITRGTGGVSGATTVTNVNFTMGGNGGSGGTGGMVIVNNDGYIGTAGLASHGIVAQSVGGGGGQGGMAISGDLAFGSKIPTGNDTYNIAIGGQGGSGNAGGEVRVTNSGTIHVVEDGSYGIYAQSVGGGGGDGGFAAAFSRNLIKNPKETLAGATSTFALGGFGGSGGDSGPVTVTHTGTIRAEGDNAFGIFAQSVSGGGGNSALSISSPVWIVADLALKTIIGGGSTGTAGKVTINTTGDIIMTGKNSIAFFSQSVNGGGGNVNQFMDFSQQAQGLGDNGLPLPGNAGDIDTAYAYLDSVITMGSDAVFGTIGAAVEATHLGSYFSDGDNGGGGLLQSVGGGGGRGSQEINMAQGSSEINLVVVLGGTNVSDSSGGNVTYNQTGGVSVTGDQSAGVTVQTIGGGGGTHFVTLRQVPQATPPPPPPPAFGPLMLPAPPPPPGAPSLTLGMNGGLNNHGGIINNTYGGAAVTTAGDRSVGLIHQSIGAGGGIEYLVGATGLNANLGAQGGASGNGGDITVVNARDIGTDGILSHAILFQSIGGGGGAIFTDLDPSLISVALNTANTGNGGNVMLTQTGDVYALGDRSTAIILQSLGGGGGLVDDVFAGAAGGTGTSGTITLVMNGSIVATGTGGSGIFAQSQGSGTQGNITVTLAAGKNLYFGEGGTGVTFSGGATNLFTNNGTVVGTDGITGWAFRGEEGDDTFQNNGSAMGNFDFGAGANAFNNAAGTVLALGPQFFLGAAGNMLTNDGLMQIGGTDLAQHTDMTGSFTQTSTGQTHAELDFGSKVLDNVSMTGSAALDGSIEVALLNPQLVPVGVFQQILIHADGGVTDNGMDLVTAPSVVINYGLNYLPTGDDLALDYSVNFNPPGSEMSRNLVEVGAHINSIQNAGSSPSLAAVIIRLLYEPTMDGYRALLSQMGPDFYGEQQAEMLRGTQRFGETVLSGGNTRFATKGRRIWFDVLGSSTYHGRFDDYKTTQQSSTGFALGFESLISRSWSAGLAVALEDNMATGYEGRWSAEGTSQRVGGVVRFRSKGTEISGLLSYGWNQMDSSRVGQVASPFDTNVERNLQTFTAMVRAAHQFGDENFAVVPRVDVGVTHLSAQNATESGADAISLYLHDVQETHAWLRPAITIRKAIPVFRHAKLRIQAEFGYQYYLTGNDTYVKGGFTGAPGGVDPMNVPIDLGSMATLSVGAQLLMANDLSIGLYYTKALSQKYKLDLVNLRVNKDF
ncbi:MAG TPA: autotransporter outer membrane beta-barrel domain-containing protein [Prosthecobacter sp.]